MKSEMHESASSLVTLDYVPYLKLLLEIVQQSPLFTASDQALHIHSAALAFQAAEQARVREQTRQEIPPLFSYTLGTRCDTIHMDGELAKNDMGKQVEALRALIKSKFTDTVTSSAFAVSVPDEDAGASSFHYQRFTALSRKDSIILSTVPRISVNVASIFIHTRRGLPPLPFGIEGIN